MMSEGRADKAHEVYLQIEALLKHIVIAMVSTAELNDDQENYVTNKLHDEIRFWRPLK